jgi:hypothetical protein
MSVSLLVGGDREGGEERGLMAEVLHALCRQHSREGRIAL